MSTLPKTSCPDGVGSINNPDNVSTSPSRYIAPTLCSGDLNITTQVDTIQEQYAAETLNISGAPINVFKLLGIHEQGVLVDLVGSGEALNGSSDAFNELTTSWVSPQFGMNVLTTPSWIGYDFGTQKTSYFQEQDGKGVPNLQHITSLRITQPVQGARALQIRVDRSDGKFSVDYTKIGYTGVGNGIIQGFTPGVHAKPGTFMLVAISPTSFSVMFSGVSNEVVGIATVGARFNSLIGSFTIVPGTVPFNTGDMFSMPVQLDWFRVDVLNLPDNDAPALVRIKQSAPSRFWRIVPTQFSGATTNSRWEVSKLELFDYQSTTLDDIQDQLFMENRDRDYAKSSVQFKVAYQPFDSISDLSKFGFQIADMYTFNTVFATMVKTLGRPIVVGDIIEIPSEMQYDHNLRPVKKFLEVTEASWAADGYTTSWRPIIYKFQATPLIPSQENRDIIGTAETQKFIVDDGTFLDGLEQISTGNLEGSDAIAKEAEQAVPLKGTNTREVSSGMDVYSRPGSYDGRDLYVEDGLPPDGLPYTEGFKLPDVANAKDQQYFRLNYDPKLNIAARLYKFNAIKNQWLYVETDRRSVNTSHKPSQLEMFNQTKTLSLSSKKV